MSDPLPTPSPPHRTRAVAKAVLQILGFVIGIAILGWCVSTALKPGNREALTRLHEASFGQIAALIGLTIVIIVASGAVFRETLVPIKRLSILPAQATNTIACLLVLAPFKLSVLFRVLVHNRRDGVPLLTIGAWFGAVGVVILCVLLPMMGGAAMRGRADTAWFIIAGGGMLACLLLVLLVARALATPRGWDWAQRLYARFPLPARLRPGSIAATVLFEKAHEGVRMLASPRVVFGCAALRLIDFAAQAGRIAIAAAIIGVPLEWDRALLAGLVFFLITAAAPSGALGAREGGTAWLIGVVLAGVDRDRFLLVVLTVSATEAAVLLIGSAISLAYLRPDRLLRLGHKPKID
ncbi:MAG TPA: lysylphosphatidylglycerol synthase domain-containing protein [Phycisphaerales bacterium]|nr:lysylphosphatidylglycerol synthase domain-containing protein [Phycisphaerales bacterium]